MAAPELRPMGIGDILDVAFRLYRDRFATFLLICLVCYVPYALLSSLFNAAAGLELENPLRQIMRILEEPPALHVIVPAPAPEFLAQAAAVGPSSSLVDATSPVALIVGAVGLLVYTVVVLPLCQGALVHNVSAAYLGTQLGAWESYARAAPRLVPLLVVQLLAALIMWVGFCCLLVVPGVIFTVWFLLITPVVMLEQRGIVGSVARSRELMRGNLGKGFLLLLVVTVLMVLVTGIIFVSTLVLPWPHPVLRDFVSTLVQSLPMPLYLAPSILLYYDLRIRKEAFDLETLAANLEGSVAA